MTRLARKYLALYDYTTVDPVVAHHLLSVAIVHLMNATSNSASAYTKYEVSPILPRESHFMEDYVARKSREEHQGYPGFNLSLEGSTCITH